MHGCAVVLTTGSRDTPARLLVQHLDISPLADGSVGSICCGRYQWVSDVHASGLPTGRLPPERARMLRPQSQEEVS